jgi:integrase
MGNRGLLHDAGQGIVRCNQGRRWICCLTAFKGRRRPLMAPGLCTELFFLAEATAFDRREPRLQIPLPSRPDGGRVSVTRSPCSVPSVSAQAENAVARASIVIDPAVHRIRIAKAEEREPRFLTWAEVEELRSWVPEYVSRIIPIAVLTMLRRGQVLGLRDADIDLASGSIAVFAQRQDGQRVATKTRAGRRSVDVGPRVVRLLREQQLAREPNADGYLFPTRAGTPFDADNFMSRVFKPAAKAAGIPELTFHDLRHTGASLMIAAGCHVKVIAEQMGYSDGGGLVLKRYGHLYKGARLAAAAVLEAHVFGSAAESPVGWTWDDRQMGLDLDAR